MQPSTGFRSIPEQHGALAGAANASSVHIPSGPVSLARGDTNVPAQGTQGCHC